MCLTEYDEAKTMAQFKEEGREEGLKVGLQKGEERKAEKTALFLLKNKMAISFVIAATELSEDRAKEIAMENGLLQ